MAFLRSTFAYFGIGGLRIELELPKTIWSAGEDIQGIVRVHGGKIALKTISLILQLQQNNSGSSGDTYRKGTTHKLDIDYEKTIEAHQIYEVPFSLKIPDETHISKKGVSTYLNAKLKTNSLRNPKRSYKIKIEVHREIKLIHQTLQDMDFKVKKSGFFLGTGD